MRRALILGTILALLRETSAATAEPQPETLIPVPLSAVEGESTSDPTLRTSENWFFGPDTSTGDAIANLTGIFTGPNQKVIAMDRVSSLIKTYSCSSDQSGINVTFKDQASYDSAKASWDWVNQQTFRSFVTTATAPGCQTGENDQGNGVGMQPYQVNGVKWNDANNLASLQAKPVTWQNALDTQNGASGNSWQLLVDTAGLSGSNPLGNKHRKRLTFDNSGKINLAHDFTQNIFKQTQDGVTVSVDCSTCNTKGSLDWRLQVIPIILPDPGIEGFAQVTPNSISAEVVISLSSSAALANGVQQSKDLFTTPLPGGIGIPGVAAIGPQLHVGFQVELSDISSKLNASVGTIVTIPNDSIAKVDFKNSKNNQLKGWTPQFHNVPPQGINDDFSVTASIGPQLTVSLEASIFGNGIGAGLAVVAPQLAATLKGAQDASGGVCGQADTTTGVNLELGIAAELDAFGGAGKIVDLPNKVKILTTSTALFSTCFPLATGTA